MKKGWIIAGVVLLVVIIAGAAYYFLVYKKTLTPTTPPPINDAQAQNLEEAAATSNQLALGVLGF